MHASCRAEHLRGVIALLTLTAAFAISLRIRGASRRDSLGVFIWLAAVTSVNVLLYVLLRGGFDYTSINKRSEFSRAGILVGLAAAALGALAHHAIWRDRDRLRIDQLTLAGIGALVTLAHPLVYGWPLGFPLPGPAMLFLPFFGAAFIASHAIAAGILFVLPSRRG
jgi:hypothetical protein